MKTKFINGSLFIISILTALLLAEGMSRWALSPANHLNLTLADDTLKHRIPGGTIGYDKWGFKNNFVPDTADIVAIGDSQTFGINASMGNTWPDQLQALSNKSVYNLSASGYGPVQYFHLFKTKALKLEPKHIIVGYYIGNDPLNSFDMVYNYKAWEKLRDSGFSSRLTTEKHDTVDYYLSSSLLNNASDGFLTGLQGWLAGNSILYRFFQGQVINSLKRRIELALAEGPEDLKYSFLNLPKKKISEAFRPIHRSSKMNINNKKIQEGLRLTFQLLDQIKAKCDQLGIELTVLLIPTKEMVYCHYLYDNKEIRYSEAINRVLNYERIIREISIKHFMGNNINFVDALPIMQQAADEVKVYPPVFEDHPNDKGYRLIAKSIYNLM